jgi:hypothetical protein
MTIRDRIHRWHSPSVFTLVALCFLLPFATVTFVSSCSASGHGTTSFTGIQLVKHTVPSGTGTGECGARQRTNWVGKAINTCVDQAAATTAEIAFGAAIVGLLLGLVGFAGGPGWCAAVGLAALVQIPVVSLGDYEVSPRSGYWLALSLFSGAGILHLRRWGERRPKRAARSHGEQAAIVIGAILLAFLSLIVAFTLKALWLVPLFWAGGLHLARATDVEDAEPESWLG